MPMRANIGGTWRNIKDPQCNIGGTWRKIKTGYSNINGVWRPFYKRALMLYEAGVQHVSWWSTPTNSYGNTQFNASEIVITTMADEDLQPMRVLSTTDDIVKTGFTKLCVDCKLDTSYPSTNAIFYNFYTYNPLIQMSAYHNNSLPRMVIQMDISTATSPIVDIVLRFVSLSGNLTVTIYNIWLE